MPLGHLMLLTSDDTVTVNTNRLQQESTIRVNVKQIQHRLNSSPYFVFKLRDIENMMDFRSRW